MIRDALILAQWNAQSFMFDKYVDLWDFCNQLIRFLPRDDEKDFETIRVCCEAVKYWIDEAVQQQSFYSGPDFQHAHGLSVFFPWSIADYTGEYRSLRFARETGWQDFIELYLRKTQRLRRGQDKVAPEAEPFRMGSDIDQLHRFGSHLAARLGSHIAARFGSHISAKFGSHISARMEAAMSGKSSSNFKNVPDGFFRQDRAKPKEFLAKNQAELEEQAD